MFLAIALHVIAAIVWVGGMFFAYVALRPAAGALLEPPQRLALWSRALGLFFPWVWMCVVVLLASGYWMVFVTYGGFAAVGLHVHIMQATGILMMLLFVHLYFAPFRRLRSAVVVEDWHTAGGKLGKIRGIVRFNLILGLITAAVASGGRYVV